MLERYVQVRHKMIGVPAVRHDRDHLVHMRIRVDIVKAHPGAELRRHPSKCLSQVGKPGPHGPPIDKIRSILKINTVSRRVLRNHQQFTHAALE